MVIFGRRDRRGTSSFGCLVSIVLLVAAGYYGYHIGQVYFRYYQLQDEMESAARMAPSLKDESSTAVLPPLPTRCSAVR